MVRVRLLSDVEWFSKTFSAFQSMVGVSIEQFLDATIDEVDLEACERRHLTVALIRCEVRRRREEGNELDLAEFTIRFPEIEADILNDLISIPELPGECITMSKKFSQTRTGVGP